MFFCVVLLTASFILCAEKKMLGKKKVAQISMPFSKFMPDEGAAGVETVTGSMGSLVLP
jgi:hypothetical protein